MIVLQKFRVFFLLLSLGFLVILIACYKAPVYPVEITVSYYDAPETTVSGAKVILEKGEVKIEGQTNASGIYAHTFDLEKILDVTVRKDIVIDGSHKQLEGVSRVRLRADQTVKRTVYLQ